MVSLFNFLKDLDTLGKFCSVDIIWLRFKTQDIIVFKHVYNRIQLIFKYFDFENVIFFSHKS